MRKPSRIIIALTVMIFQTSLCFAFRLRDEGVIVGEAVEIDCVGSSIACTRNAQQHAILTISGSGGGSGDVGTGVQGYFSYYPANGTQVDDQTALYTDGTNVGIGTTTTSGGKLTIYGVSTGPLYSASGVVSSLGDAGADKIVFWDDSEATAAYLSVASPLTISGVTPQLGLDTVGIGYGGTGQTTRQAAIDALTDADNATAGYVLTSDGTNAAFTANTSSLFSDSTTTTYLTATGDDFVIGATAPVNSGKLTIISTDDQATIVGKGASGQTANLLELKTDAESNRFIVGVDGSVSAGDGSASGVLTLPGASAMVQTGTTDANTLSLRAYDVNGTSYSTFQTGTAANSPTWAYSDFPGKWKATIISPTATTSDGFLDKATAAGTITSISCIVDPADTGESVVLTINECDSTGDNCAGVDGATTITCDNDGAADDGALSNAAYDSGDIMSYTIGTVTGTASKMFFEVRKKETQTVTK